MIQTKKGQLTIFVIMGLIVLILLGVSFYLMFTTSTQQESPERDFDVSYNPQLGSLIAEIETCSAALVEEYMKDVSKQGGFENTEDVLTGIMPAHRNTGVELFEGSGSKIPMWFRLDDDMNCEDCDFEYNIPILEGDHPGTIQYNAQRYVLDNLEDCTDGLRSFEYRFDIEYGDVADVEVIFTNQDTVVRTVWPVTVMNPEDGQTSTLTNYETSLDLPAKKVYDTALDVLHQVILRDNAVDRYIMDIKEFLTMGEDAPLPPTSGEAEIGFGAPRTWFLNDGEQVLRQELFENSNIIQIVGTKNSFWLDAEDDYDTEFLRSHSYELSNNDFLHDLHINFNYYPHWPIFLDVNPSSGPVVMPDREIISIPMFPLAITHYDFTYDMSYPVMVSIREDTALGGEGFELSFAVEGNVQRDRLVGETTFFETPDSMERGSNALQNVNQRTVEASVRVLDGVDESPISGVDVFYMCNEELLSLETTGSDGVASGYLPPCIDGYFAIGGAQYFAQTVQESLLLDEVTEAELYAYSEVEVPISYEKLATNKVNQREEAGVAMWDYGLSTSSVVHDQDEEVFVMFSRIAEDGEDAFVRSVEWSAQDTDKTISLVPGEYEILGMVTLYVGEEYSRDEIVLEEEVLCADASTSILGGLITIGGDECFTVEGSEFNESLMTGFVAFEEGNEFGTFSVEPGQLVGGEELTIYMKSYNFRNPGVFRYTRDLDILGFITDMQVEERGLLEPRWN